MTGWLTTLRNLGENASESPWFVVGPPWNEGAPWINAGSEDPHDGEPVCDSVLEAGDETKRSEENTAFIVAARNLWQPLLDVAEAAARVREHDDNDPRPLRPSLETMYAACAALERAVTDTEETP